MRPDAGLRRGGRDRPVGFDKKAIEDVFYASAAVRMEQPHDLLLSTLNSYLGAIGGRASVIVTFADGHETTLDLSQLT